MDSVKIIVFPLALILVVVLFLYRNSITLNVLALTPYFAEKIIGKEYIDDTALFDPLTLQYQLNKTSGSKDYFVAYAQDQNTVFCGLENNGSKSWQPGQGVVHDQVDPGKYRCPEYKAK